MTAAVVILAFAVPVSGWAGFLIGDRRSYWRGYDKRDSETARWPKPSGGDR